MQSTNSEYGSLHFTLTKFVYVWLRNIFTSDCFPNEGQFKAGFVKMLKLKDRPVPIVNDPATPPEEVSLTLYSIYFLMIICKSPLLFHRREGRGEQNSLSCKETCTETSRCEWSCFWQGVVLHDHWDHFKKTLNHTNLWKMGIRYSLWSTATTGSNLLWDHSEVKI